jgi:hypothetical protein
MYNDKKLISLILIVWAVLALFFIFIFGLFDAPFYVEYDDSIEVMVNYGRGFEYEEEEGRITAVGWGIILLSLTIALRIIAELETIFNPRSSSPEKSQKFLINFCIIGAAIFVITEAILFKVLFFRLYKQENIGHFTFLNFISIATDITLVLLIYAFCKKCYKKLLNRHQKL